MENLRLFNFQHQDIPQPWEPLNITDDSRFVPWGVDNQYPNFLLKLFAESPIHSAIINSKSNYIIGGGLKTADGKPVDIKVNAEDNVGDFISKIVKDLLIFNAFAVEVIYDVFNRPIEYHFIPVNHIRMNKTKTKFWFSQNWLHGGKRIVYDRWVEKNNDSNSKIFYFDGYFPSIQTVNPSPEYAGSIKAITTDMAIRDFNLHNIKNNFSPNTIITFFQGNVSEDVKKAMVQNITETHTGENGKKIIIDFQTLDGKPAEVKQLSDNQWADVYNSLSQNVKDDILIGHQVVSPALFGVKTAGQLGNTQELETAYEIFKRNYVQVKRTEIEMAVNRLFSGFSGISGRVAFADVALFNSSISETTKEKIYTINELRKEAGLPPLPNGDRLLTEAAPAAQPAPAQPEVVANSADDVKKKTSRKLTEDDFEMIKHLGKAFQDFEVVEQIVPQKSKLKFTKEEDVAQYVIEHDIKGLTLEQLNTLLQSEIGVNETPEGLKTILDGLHESGLVKVEYDSNNRINITPSTVGDVPDTNAISVMYQYIKRPGIAGNDLLPTSRGFCVKLIENNRLYKRSEIQQMASIFGYDVFKYAGGFYHNPDTDETTPYCRHDWQALRVKPVKR